MFNITESTVRLALFAGGILFFLVAELLIPYRPASVSKLKRWVINLALTLLNSVLLNLLFSVSIAGTAAYVQGRGLGVLNLVQAPAWLRIVAALVLMDFILYVWHFLNHEMPLLWRFHRVHHSDLNMDVSTATRFHVGELSISAAIKIGLIFFLGVGPAGLLAFECAVVLCAQFEHSCVKVPGWFETVFWVLFVPPGMHRIHHSVAIKERNTNYGTIFSLWDRFLGTLVTDVDQEGIRIGVGAYREPERLNFHHLLVMPFTRPVR